MVVATLPPVVMAKETFTLALSGPTPKSKTPNMQLQLATRQKVKLRMSISGPTGFGKTYGALLIAYGITGDWGKIAVIDTENKSASLYAHLGPYYTIPIEPPYTTEKYNQALGVCEKGGIEVVIIDSVTHVWKGEGGLLEYNNSLGGRYADWAKTTPLYQKWLNRILHSSCHVITTMRKKQAYAMVTEGNKTKVEKKGLEDEIRDGFDFEMTVAFEVTNENHMARAAKDRTGLFDGKPEFVITPETGKMIAAWCDSGADVLPVWIYELETITTQKGLVDLYNAHRMEIDLNPKLQQAISNRRTAINTPKGSTTIDLLDEKAERETPTYEERQLLKSLVNVSDMEEDEKHQAFEDINNVMDYKSFQDLQYKLEARRRPLDQITNPTQGDINHHLLTAVH